MLLNCYFLGLLCILTTSNHGMDLSITEDILDTLFMNCAPLVPSYMMVYFKWESLQIKRKKCLHSSVPFYVCFIEFFFRWYQGWKNIWWMVLMKMSYTLLSLCVSLLLFCFVQLFLTIKVRFRKRNPAQGQMTQRISKEQC